MVTITSDTILGKDAVDPHGAILGVVTELHIDKGTKQIVGLTVDMGFMKPDLYVGMEYVRMFGVDTVFLNRRPVDRLKGMEVVTADGKVLGIVAEVIQGKKLLKKLVVRTSYMSNTMLDISAKSVKTIGDNIILKKDYGAEEK